jgi:hypothetical protein
MTLILDAKTAQEKKVQDYAREVFEKIMGTAEAQKPLDLQFDHAVKGLVELLNQCSLFYRIAVSEKIIRSLETLKKEELSEIEKILSEAGYSKTSVKKNLVTISESAKTIYG